MIFVLIFKMPKFLRNFVMERVKPPLNLHIILMTP